MPISDRGREMGKRFLSTVHREDLTKVEEQENTFCTVTAVSGNLVSVKTSKSTTGGHLIARVQGMPPSVGDRGVLLPVEGGSSVYLPIDKGLDNVATQAELAAKADIVHGHGGTILPFGVNSTTGSSSSTPNLATLEVKYTLAFTLTEGTWGAVFMGSGMMMRNVGSGSVVIGLKVGGATKEVARAWADTSTSWVNAFYMSISHPRDNIVVGSGGASDTVQLLFRGEGTAGTTYISNADLHGFFYRIS